MSALPRKRTNSGYLGTSALCQNQTHAPQQKASDSNSSSASCWRCRTRLKSSSGASRQKRFGKLADIGDLFEVINEIDQRIASAKTKRFIRKIEAASKFREMLLARKATRWTSQHDSAVPAQYRSVLQRDDDLLRHQRVRIGIAVRRHDNAFRKLVRYRIGQFGAPIVGKVDLAVQQHLGADKGHAKVRIVRVRRRNVEASAQALHQRRTDDIHGADFIRPERALPTQRHDSLNAAVRRAASRIGLMAKFADQPSSTETGPRGLQVPRTFVQPHVSELSLEHVARTRQSASRHIAGLYRRAAVEADLHGQHNTAFHMRLHGAAGLAVLDAKRIAERIKIETPEPRDRRRRAKAARCRRPKKLQALARSNTEIHRDIDANHNRSD